MSKDGGAKGMRTPLARARDEWLRSEEGKRCRAGEAQGQYLQNRLEMAFIAGWDAAMKEPK